MLNHLTYHSNFEKLANKLYMGPLKKKWMLNVLRFEGICDWLKVIYYLTRLELADYFLHFLCISRLGRR